MATVQSATSFPYFFLFYPTLPFEKSCISWASLKSNIFRVTPQSTIWTPITVGEAENHLHKSHRGEFGFRLGGNGSPDAAAADAMNNRSGSYVIWTYGKVLERELPVPSGAPPPHWWSICQLVCTEPGAAIVLRLPPKQGTVLWPNSGRVNGLRQQVFLPGTVRSGEAVLVQRCPSGGRAMKMDVGRGEKSYLCHLTSPGSLHGFPQSAQSNFSPDSIEHGGLTGRGPSYDKAVPVSDSSGQGAQGCATTALDGGNFRVTLGARSTMETLMGKLASLLGTQNAGSELNTWGQSSVN